MPREYKSPRHKDLAAIHAARRKLNMNEDNYRALIYSVTGKTSSAELQGRERARVIAALNKLVPASERKSVRPKPASERKPLLKKVYAQLYDLEQPLAYAESILKQMFKDEAPARLEWATPTQLHALVKALVYQQKREGKGEN